MKKRRHQEIINDNRNLPVSHQSTMKHQKQNLLINGEKYVKEVEVPPIKEILIKNRNIDKAFAELKIHSGPMKSVNGSTFYAYAVQANNFEKIKETYQIIKEEHISATHVMCGYRVFGTRHYNLQDFSNDGEHSGGRTILEKLRSAKVWNMAVFIVRYHEGPNLGRLRLEIIGDLTSESNRNFSVSTTVWPQLR